MSRIKNNYILFLSANIQPSNVLMLKLLGSVSCHSLIQYPRRTDSRSRKIGMQTNMGSLNLVCGRT